MANDIEFLKQEVVRLHAETLALQWLLTSLAGSLKNSGAVPEIVIEQAFDSAANIVEEIAIRLGKEAAPEHTVGALRIVEQLRKQVFPG